MNKISIAIFLISSILCTGKTFASDSTQVRKRLFLSVSAGYTSNSVYGSMVKRNNQFGENVKMENRGGYMINVNIQKALSNVFFLHSGIGFVQKQVNPMVNTYALYKDSLKTAYLTVPVELGVNVLPLKSSVSLAFTLGSSANFRIADKSYSGPDRVGFETSSFTASLLTGANLSYWVSSKIKLFGQYTYIHDVTKSYVETLYWNSQEPNKEFIYKYKTSAFSLGLQWPI